MTARTLSVAAPASKSGTASSRPKEPRWGPNGRSNPVARAAADRLGLSESYVEQLLRAKTGKNIVVAELIREMRAQGQDAQALRYYAPIQRAYEERVAQPLTLKLVEDVTDACHAEHIAELRWLASRSDADLSMEIRALDRAMAKMVALHDAAVAEEQRRMGRPS